MFKKVLIGDTCGRIVDHIFAQPHYYTSLEMLMAVILFGVQIYNDFSGYSHIARGVARLLGIDLVINFRQPYLSSNIGDFWRRWHISLASWVKDYVYIPLGGSRKGEGRTYLNIVITMMLFGLWHGAQWTFVIYGGLHGLYLCVYRLFSKSESGNKKITRLSNYPVIKWIILVLKIVVVNLLIFIPRIFFRAENFQTAFYFFKSFAKWVPGGDAVFVVTVTLSFTAVSAYLDLLEKSEKNQAFLMLLKPSLRYGIICGSWLAILIFLLSLHPTPFYYFQF